MNTLSGEYQKRGEYHRHLDRRWRYYPIYVAKMAWVRRYLRQTPRDAAVLDVGCGEGLLVEEFRAAGHNITGLDLNYESACVMHGDITDCKLPKESYDLILCLDMIEHLTFEDQERAIRELHRLLKPDGTLLVTVPNLAHLSSRLWFLLTGNLIRTSTPDRHKGDRPLNEYKRLFGRHFDIRRIKGFFPTFPLSSLLTLAAPGHVGWLHGVLNTWFAYPNWCFLNLFLLQKKPLQAASPARLPAAAPVEAVVKPQP